MSSSQRVVGLNMMLAAVLALLSYVPFEWVAKGSLVFSVFLFVFDPLPGVTRLLALLSVIVVAMLSRAHRHLLEQQQQRNDAVANVDIAGEPKGGTASMREQAKKEE